MSRFTAEEREAIMADAREALAHEPRDLRADAAAPLGRRASPSRCRRCPSKHAARITWHGLDQRIANAIAVEREHQQELHFGEALVEALDEQRANDRDELADAVRSLRLELAKAQATICEMRHAAATERGKVLDLPNPLRRVN